MHLAIHRLLFAVLLLAGNIAASDEIGITEEPVMELSVESETPANSVPADSLVGPDILPVLTTFVKAEYPAYLVKKGVAGTVTLELLISETGTVDSAAVLRGVVPELDSCAVRAARRFVFSPAMADSVPVAVLLQYDYRFTLADAVDSLIPYSNFSGRCLEKGTRKPVPDAVIAVTVIDSTTDTTLPVPFSTWMRTIGTFTGQSIDEGRLVAVSDSAGEFRFYSLPACGIAVRVLMPGYAPFETEEFLTKTEALHSTYYIERQAYSEYEIMVYGKQAEKEVSRRQLTIGEVRKIPGLGGDAVKVIQTLPGVARPTMGSGEIVVRGAPSWDSRYFVDGMEIPVLYHFGGIKSTYNSEALSGIDFYPGGFGTRYGGAIAGVVEIAGRKGTSERIKAAGELSTLDGSIFVEGPVRDSVTFMVSVRRSFLGEIIQPIIRSMPDQFPFTVYPFYWDYLCRTDVATKNYGNFFVTLFGSRDSMSFIFPEMRLGSDELTEQTDRLGWNTTFNMGILGWDWTINRMWKNSFRYQLMNISSDFGSPFGRNSQKIWVDHIREQLSFSPGKHVTVNLGADVQWSLADLSYALPDAFNVVDPGNIEDWRFGDLAGYLNVEWEPTDKVQIIPGVRYDYYPELNYRGSLLPAFWEYHLINNKRGFSGEPSARLTARYEFIDRHTAKIALGTYNQTPEPMGEVLMEKWGNPALGATKAAHYVGGYEWQVTDLISIDAQTYFNRQWDIPVHVGGSDLDPSAESQPLYKGDGMGRMYGFELLIRHLQGDRFFGWLAYTLSRSERYNRTDGEWEFFDLDQTHHIQLLGSWRLPRNWEAGFRLRYVTGNPTTPVDRVIEVENYPGAFSFRPVYGPKNSSRVDPFFQLDIRVDKKFVFNKWLLSVFWDLQNLSYFVYKSPEFEIYNYDYSDKMAFSNFPMFAIGLKAEF